MTRQQHVAKPTATSTKDEREQMERESESSFSKFEIRREFFV